MSKKQMLLILAVLSSLIITSCKSADESRRRREQDELSEFVEKEREIGRAVFAKLAGKFGVWHNQEATEYLNKLGKSVALYSQRQELEYFFAILDTEQINAYALPGGYILISKGAIKSINNKGELLGILAHELGHIDKKHVLEGVNIQVKMNFFESLARILAGPRQVITAVVGQVTDKIEETLFIQGLAADDEFEADQYAVELLQSLGISAVDYYNYLQRLSKNPYAAELAELGKTHPDIKDRIEKIEKILNKELKSSKDTENFLAFMKIINTI